MTREKALNSYSLPDTYSEPVLFQIINEIYDDFEKEPIIEQLNNECIRLRKEVQELQEEINIMKKLTLW